ncbi:MAG: hypothetical protein M1826_002409 [Phylliscum demangeonii]|nr:MAG: hypothetical protein M1826_002409 [Phylliscum demangeonii]
MASKIEKTLARLQERIHEGHYYEAHQQLRVVASRYVKQENWAAALEVLFNGAQSLLRAEQYGSGIDICLFIVNVLRDAQMKPDSANKGKLISLLRLFPAEEPGRKRFGDEMIGWSATTGEFPAGDPELHDATGMLFAQEHETYDAERHLILGTKSATAALVDLEFAWYTEDESHTAPLYAARAVLPYLMTGNVHDATRSLSLYQARLTDTKPNLTAQDVREGNVTLKIFPSLPLLNFLGLLLLAVQRGKAATYRQLRKHYALHIKDAGSWDEALDHIGEMYFGIPIRRHTNPLFDMMGGLFGGGGGQSSQKPAIRRVEPAPEMPAADLD